MKELNDKNQQMKDVVEAYESLFDKMKSSHNIKHLDSSLEDQEEEESKNSLEDTKDDSETATNENDNVLLIDDLIATGGTAEAAAKLVETSGGTVSGFLFVINLYDLGGIKLLENKGYKAYSLLDFPGH